MGMFLIMRRNLHILNRVYFFYFSYTYRQPIWEDKSFNPLGFCYDEDLFEYYDGEINNA